MGRVENAVAIAARAGAVPSRPTLEKLAEKARHHGDLRHWRAYVPTLGSRPHTSTPQSQLKCRTKPPHGVRADLALRAVSNDFAGRASRVLQRGAGIAQSGIAQSGIAQELSFGGTWLRQHCHPLRDSVGSGSVALCCQLRSRLPGMHESRRFLYGLCIGILDEHPPPLARCVRPR
jgi:hypothetical protein